jgi:hypothetical protein
MNDRGQGKLIYLASPYSDRSAKIMRQRYLAAVAATGAMIRAGLNVYCPVAYTHTLAELAGLDARDHALWMPLDLAILARADALWVLTLPGWAESRGIKMEVEAFTSEPQRSQRAQRGILDFCYVHFIAAPKRGKNKGQGATYQVCRPGEKPHMTITAKTPRRQEKQPR